MLRLIRLLAISFYFCLGLSSANRVNCCAGAESSADAVAVKDRNWKQFPAIVKLPPPKIIYALGDVHGDCDRMVGILAAGGLIGVEAGNRHVRWTGRNAVLVLTGDQIDKFNQNLAVIAALRELQSQAEQAGGQIIVCLGNHECEFLGSGGSGKKSAEFEAELRSAGISPAAVAAGEDPDGIGHWLRNLPAGAKVGDWFFCHAGNTSGRQLTDLESNLEKSLAEQGYATPLLTDPNSMLEARMHPRPWFDGKNDLSLKPITNSKPKSTQPPAKLREVLAGLEVKHLVIGHQPGEITFSDGMVRPAGEIFEHYNGAFFLIDTGMSRGVAVGHPALLCIDVEHDNASVVSEDGKSTRLWPR